MVVEVLAGALSGPAVSPPGTVSFATEPVSAELPPPHAAIPIASAAPVAPVAAIVAMRLSCVLTSGILCSACHPLVASGAGVEVSL